MYFSKYNIFSKIKDSDNFFIVNPLSGSADILTPDDAVKILKVSKEEDIHDPALISELQEKGYLADVKQEQKLFRYK